MDLVLNLALQKLGLSQADIPSCACDEALEPGPWTRTLPHIGPQVVPRVGQPRDAGFVICERMLLLPR